MWAKGQYLINDINGVQAPPKQYKALEFHKIINMQQNVIKTLKRELTYLRQYVILVTSFDEIKPADISFQSTMSELKNMSEITAEKTMNKVYGIKSLLEDIMFSLNVSEPKEILSEIKKLDQRANRKVQPIFIEKIKEKQVPIYIQKIKEIEKPIILQKVKTQEKIIYSNNFQTNLDRKNAFLQIQDFSQKLKHHNQNYEMHDPCFLRFRSDKFQQKKPLKKKKPKRYMQKKQN